MNSLSWAKIGLLQEASHYITRGHEAVEDMMAVEKKMWLHGIQIAREVCENAVEMETDQLQNAMLSWLAMASSRNITTWPPLQMFLIWVEVLSGLLSGFICYMLCQISWQDMPTSDVGCHKSPNLDSTSVG